MEDMQAKQKALDVLFILNSAIKNIRLYPPASATVSTTIDKLYSTILDVLDRNASLLFAESEKNILVDGDILSQKDQEKPHVSALLHILTGFGLKSVTFNSGLSKEELSVFIELLSKKPEAVNSQGGLSTVMADRNLSHIVLDQKVYVAVDKGHKVVANLDAADEPLLHLLMNADTASAADSRQLQDIVNDPERLARIFQAGLSQIMAEEGSSPDADLSGKIENMVVLLDKVAGHLGKNDQTLLAERIGQSIASVDDAVKSQLSAQNLEHLFGGLLMQYVTTELAQKKATEPQTADSAGQVGAEDSDVVVESREAGPDLTINLEEALSQLLDENVRPSMNAPLMTVLPRIIEQLIAQKQEETMEIVIERLIKNMFSEDAGVRNQESKALVDIYESLAPNQQIEMVGRMAGLLIDWIKYETVATPAYEKICIILRDLVRSMIAEGRYAETNPILDAFNDIGFGILEKNDKIRDIADVMIRNLADEAQMTLLVNEFFANEQNKQVEAGRVLIGLGENALNRLLDILREIEDSDLRIRIMHLIIDMGPRALPCVRNRINDQEPWYYLRNLAYLLGQIGNEESAAALHPFLRHNNDRLRTEVLKSIYRTGGSQRGRMLISALADADESFKISIVETIGNAKCADVVTDLVNVLKTRPLVASALRMQLEEKICTALGSIGSNAAIPCLSEIAESKSFLRLRRAYPEKLKLAAGKALTSIRKKQAA